MVEGARLESVYTGNCIKGSNPFLSAREKAPRIFISQGFFMFLRLSNLEVKSKKIGQKTAF